jgi:hypothetical protein
MVVPAFATSSGGPGVYTQPAIRIDSVKMLNGSTSGSVIDWPNNFYAAYGSSVVVSSSVASFNCLLSDNILETYFYPGSVSKISLRLSDVFLLSDTVFSVDDDNLEHVRFSSLSISGYVNQLSSSSGAYEISSAYFSETVNLGGSRSVDIADAIRHVVAGVNPSVDQYDCWLSIVQVVLSYFYDDLDATPMIHFSVSQSSSDTSFKSWFNSSDLSFVFNETVVEMPGMFDWLRDSIESFFELEIAPGFSLNGLFYIVLVIAVLLAVVKLMT